MDYGPLRCQHDYLVVHIIMGRTYPPRVADGETLAAARHTRYNIAAVPHARAYGYCIYEGIGATSFDTIFDAETSSYIVKKQADTTSRFRIATIDTCFNNGLISRERQVFACKVEGLMCERKLNLSWSNAQKSISNIVRFDIMLSQNNGAYTRVATVDSLQNSATIDISGHLDKFKVYVRAVSSDTLIYANSMYDSITLIAAPKPLFAYLETLNVTDANKRVEMRCHVDMSTIWENLFVYAEKNLVQTLTYNEFQKNNQLLLPYQQGFYHFEISDTCGQIAITSNLAKPIHLEAQLTENTVDLAFSTYQGWPGTDPLRYDVFEIKDGDTMLQSSLWVDSDSVYRHSVILTSPTNILNLSYYIVAHEGSSNPYGITATAKSNVVDVISEHEIPIYFPTGFIPESSGSSYRPYYIPRVGDEIQFHIYNKFGQLVFSTEQPKHGWNGIFKGSTQPVGVYFYVFVLTRNGHTMQKKGVFTLVR